MEELSWDRRRCRHCGTEVRLSSDRTRVELLQWLCPHCGTNNTVGTNYCRQCGQVLAQRCTACGAEEYVGSRFCSNCGRPLHGAAPIPDQPAAAVPVGKPETSAWAIASLVLAILGLGPLAVACGHLALWQINRSVGRVGGQWLAVIGLVVGYLQVGFLLLALLSYVFGFVTLS